MYTDEITGSMTRAIEETNRRRDTQMKFNKENHITPETVKKEIRALISDTEEIEEEISKSREKMILESPEFPKLISELEEQMKMAANNLEFESAARIRDKIKSLLKTHKRKDSG